MAWSKGVSIAYSGACKDKCKDLFNNYALAVQKAKVCCLMCNSIQCQKQVKHQLVCGCSTFVQATNTAALQQMALYQKEWNALGCAKNWACTGTPGPVVNGSTCKSDRVGSGVCVDLSTTPP